MDLLSQLSGHWWAWMGPMLWQSSLLVVVVGVIDLSIRRWAWPQVRYVLWLLVLVKLLLPPAWSLPTGVVPRLERQLAAHVELPWTPAARSPGAGLMSPGAQQPSTAGSETTADESGAASTGAPHATPPTTPVIDLKVYAFAAWFLGMLGFSILLAARYAALRRWHDRERQGQTIPPWYHRLLVKTAQRLGTGRLPAIVFSDRLLAPAVCGVLRPVMYLPRDYTETLTPEEAEHVLLHELAHLKRGDLWLHALGLLMQVVYWFNPFVALALRRLQHVREICTDLMVADVLRERTAGYRQTLLDTARRLLTESAAPGLGLLGVFEEPFRLVTRLRWLERPTWHKRSAARATAVMAAAALLVFVLPMGSGALKPGEPSRSSEAEESSGGTDALAEVAASRDSDTRSGALAEGVALYVRNETRREKRFLTFRYEVEPLGIGELWIGDGVLSAREAGRTTIVNLPESSLTYVNHDDQSYVVASLPLNLDTILIPEVREYVRSNAVTGRVIATGRKGRVLGHRCREFRVESWSAGARARSEPVVYSVWACNRVPVDLGVFRVFLDCQRRLHGREDTYAQELLKLDGLQLRLRRDVRAFPYRIRTVDEVVEMEMRQPPPGVFEPPAGYTRRERIAQL